MINDKLILESDTLDETREIYLYLPPDLSKDNQPYPVIYTLDGNILHNVFASFVQYYSRFDRIPDVIIVGIACPDRLRDFTPTARKTYDGEYGGGGADKFLKFLQEELFPVVEEKYSTRDYRVLMGHSLGGLFVTYALSSRPELFRAYLACSPWFYEQDNTLIDALEKRLKKGFPEKKLFYLAHEPITRSGIENRILRMKQVFENSSGGNLEWEYRKYLDGDHINLPLKAIPDALNFFFPGYIKD